MKIFKNILNKYSSFYTLQTKLKYSHRYCTVTNNPSEMTTFHLQTVLKKLNDFAPIELAESWDNVGLLVEPATSRPISHILLTNDLTEAVLQEAIKLDASMIITYHPSIFTPLKSITMRNWKDRITATCLENRIAIFSPHTSWDCVKGGVNDWLANTFSNESSFPIIKGEHPETGAGRICKLKSSISVKKAVELVKARINLPHVRLALGVDKTMNSMITTVAVCAGSGASVLKGVKADLLLTGEMLHHDVLNATQNGQHVILCNHSDSERGFLKEFKTVLEKMFNKEITVSVSKKDKDPLITV